jgi:hypothetical protein
MKPVALQTYLLAFIATALVIVGAIFASNYLTTKKTDELKSIANKITIDSFALEAKIDILEKSSCESMGTLTLMDELQNLGSRLTFMESQVGVNDPDLFRLKRYYALLESKDFLFTSEIAKRCSLNIPVIVYFYNQLTCEDCVRQEYVLRALRENNAMLHVYLFDYTHDRQAITGFLTSPLGSSTPPILIINKKKYEGFKSVIEIENILYATSTQKTI